MKEINYQVWEKYFKNWNEFEIIKKEWWSILIKWDIWQFAVSDSYKFDN